MSRQIWNKNIPTVSIGEFEFALSLIDAAARNRMQVQNPETIRFDIEHRDGSVAEYRFTDRPLTRGLLAVQDSFDPDVARSIAMRFWLLCQCLEYPSIKNEHVETGDSHSLLSPVLVAAVATVPWPGPRHPQASHILKHIKTLKQVAA